MVSPLRCLSHLATAAKLIDDILFEASVIIWDTLLGVSVLPNGVELDKFSAHHVLGLKLQDDTTYVLFSNVYGALKKNIVAFVQKSMKEQLKKEPEISWVENQGRIHYFSVEDASLPEIDPLRWILDWFYLVIRGSGYVSYLGVLNYTKIKSKLGHILLFLKSLKEPVSVWGDNTFAFEGILDPLNVAKDQLQCGTGPAYICMLITMSFWKESNVSSGNFSG